MMGDPTIASAEARSVVRMTEASAFDAVSDQQQECWTPGSTCSCQPPVGEAVLDPPIPSGAPGADVILVVDDMVLNRKLLSTMARKLGTC